MKRALTTSTGGGRLTRYPAEKESADSSWGAERDSLEAVAKDIADMPAGALSLKSDLADLDGTALANAIFSAELNVPTAPVESDLGWHIFRVTEITDEATDPFDAVKDRLRIEIAQNDALDRIFEIANQIEDALAGGETIEEAAKNVGVDAQTFAALDAQGRDMEGNQVGGIVRDPSFRTTLFETLKRPRASLRKHATADISFCASMVSLNLRFDRWRPSKIRLRSIIWKINALPQTFSGRRNW